MMRALIINADDCNLTRGVTRAILECHDTGIVSSTTFMANLPIESETVREIKRRKSLGVGIHLNVTLGAPVSKPRDVSSLLASDGCFRKLQPQLESPPKANQLELEYQAQIDLFQKAFSRRPTHLDTHHQVHNHPVFLKVLSEVARKNKLPVRRSALLSGHGKQIIRTTDFIFGNLNAAEYWRPGPLTAILENLPAGVSEIMCHPGYNDAELRAISSFTQGRAEEMKLFRSPHLRALIFEVPARLSHFGMCYT